MILAAGDFDWVAIVVMVIFGLISWISSKLKGTDEQPPAKPTSGTRPAPSTGPKPTGDSEEDRMRRFFEALGIPEAQSAPRPVATPVSRPRPVPPPVPPVSSPVIPPPIPHVPPVRPRRPLDEEEALLTRSESPVAVTPRRQETDMLEEEISRLSAKAEALKSTDVRGVSSVSSGQTAARLKAALSNPQDLRTAFLLREILGPPPGLRS